MNNAHRVVSSETEELILVDNDDNDTGYLSKADCHDGEGILHRAFSLFLFNDDGELLLQQDTADVDQFCETLKGGIKALREHSDAA